jgi:hypothetical protein
MLGGIFTWLIIGLIIYFMVSGRGGMMGCCGGHHHDRSGHNDPANPHGKHSPESDEDTIDLNKEDYHVRTNRW